MTDRPLNILYLCADKGLPFLGAKGGSVHMREFVTSLRNSGHKVVVVAKDKGNGKADDYFFGLPDNSAKNIFESAANFGDEKDLISEFQQFCFNNDLMKFLYELHQKFHFDLVYERYSLFGLAGESFARKARLPFVLEVNSPLIQEAVSYRSLKMKGLALAVESHLFKSANHIIAVSDSVRKYIAGIASDTDISVLPNGVSIERFSNLEVKASDREFTVAFVGNLRPWHGVDILIDSFAQFFRKSNIGRLLIIGGGDMLRKSLEQKCAMNGLDGRVEFTGAISFDDVPKMLANADVAVAPYPEMQDFYFSPLKLLEYMAAGKAIVASNIGQVAEILKDEETALLVPPGNRDCLAAALERLYKDPVMMHRLGQNARKEACQKHTWNQRINDIDVIFQDLINRD